MSSRRRVSLLVPEVHPMNWWLHCTLSFVVDVHVRAIHPWCQSWPRGRMQLVDLEAFFTPDSANLFKSRSLAAWERWLHRVPAHRWQTPYRGLPLDFTVKAKQELSQQFERLLLLKDLQARPKPHGAAYVVTSASFRYLASLEPGSDGLAYHEWPWLSQINIWCDLVWLRVGNLVYGLRLLSWLGRPWGRRRSPSPLFDHERFQFFYECDNPNEVRADPKKRHVTWLVDGQVIRQAEMLFLLPRGTSRDVVTELQTAGYAASTLPEAYRFVARADLLRAVADTVRVLGSALLNLWARFESLVMGGYLLRVGTVAPVVERWCPRVYLESVSSLANESPSLVYLKRLGTTSVMYFMATSYMFSKDVRMEECDLRAVLFSHVLASQMVVWHADYKRFYESHPQDGVAIRVIGPLMPGDELIMQRQGLEARRTLGLDGPSGNHHVYTVVAFDAAAARRPYLLDRHSHQDFYTYPDCYSEEYTLRFLQDMWRLLTEDGSIRLVYKPRRNSWESEFYSEHALEILERIRGHARGLVLDEEINPWLPLALADVCVSLAFTSPGLAALHYRLPIVFHDPMGIARSHRYQGLEGHTTHRYDRLLDRLVALRRGGAAGNRADHTVPSAVSDFIGEHPGTNSSHRFRVWLKTLGGTDQRGHSDPALTE